MTENNLLLTGLPSGSGADAVMIKPVLCSLCNACMDVLRSFGSSLAANRRELESSWAGRKADAVHVLNARKH